jgi:hydrogenase maturation protein HypF
MTVGMEGQPATHTRIRVRVEGVVRGVGFRPYVDGLATELRLGGFVESDVRAAVAEVEGTPAAVEDFVARLAVEAPPMAVIERVETRALGARGQREFTIMAGAGPALRVSPDMATCRACLDEMADPRDRRYRYPFTSCARCGPRYTIVRDISDDGQVTTAAGRPLCGQCMREHRDPGGRRYRAPATSCPACGPRLRLVTADGRPVDDEHDPVAATSHVLKDGLVVAVKGLGGYHLAVDAADEQAVAFLRSRTRREERPFAIMIADLATARTWCDISPREAALLTSSEAPIVVLHRTGGPLAPGVAPGTHRLGVMLPHTPVHHLLAAEHDGPIVFTSGNAADEPAAYSDADARSQLSRIAHAFLTHDRPIHTRVGDAVVQVVRDQPVPLRRGRGFAPRPVTASWEFPRHVLGVGAELDNTVCLAKGRDAFMSQHIGDVKGATTFASFSATIRHLSRLLAVTPAVVAHDLDATYLTTRHARALGGVDHVAVQHHHAHVAACLADNGVTGPAIGVVFDGGGVGTDGTIWGGEILVADLEQSTRVGHLEAVPLPGESAVREPWRMAASYLRAAYTAGVPGHLALPSRHRDHWDDVLSAAGAADAPLSSSAERLFDAVAALVGVRDAVRYEGQAAVDLEQVAEPWQSGAYRTRITGTEPFVIRSTDLIRAVVDDLRRGEEVATIAAWFHAGVANVIAEACERSRAAWGLDTVALSGGGFQNVLLAERTIARLEASDFRVLTHVRVPPNDGGISLGQAVVAGARDRAP